MARNNSFGFTVCIVLTLLCTFISATPVEKAAAAHISQAPHIAQRDVVTVTKDAGLISAQQINAPYYDPQCQVGGCTFSYEVSDKMMLSMKARNSTSNALQSVSLFYWPSSAPNTACLATLADPPVLTPPAGLLMYVAAQS